MAFDPDEYLKEKDLEKSQKQAAEFNPDAYLANPAGTESGVNPVPQVAGAVRGAVAPLSTGAATTNVRDALNIAKNATSWTPNALTEVVTHPLSTLRAYVQGHPMANTPIRQIAGGIGRNVVGAMGTGLAGAVLSPESAFTAPYQMAAMEQDRIRANPTAPEYATNPYAQQYRGEAPTQGAAGAMNQRRAVVGQQYGGLSPEDQARLEEDQAQRMIRYVALKKALGQ